GAQSGFRIEIAMKLYRIVRNASTSCDHCSAWFRAGAARSCMRGENWTSGLRWATMRALGSGARFPEIRTLRERLAARVDDQSLDLLIDVATRYYLHGNSQIDIARELRLDPS